MSDDRRRGSAAIDVASLAEFARGYQQQGLKNALAVAGPFAVVRLAKSIRKGR